MPPAQDLTRAYQDLVRIGTALTQETDLPTLLDRVLTEARWFTSAEAGTLYLLEGDRLHFAVVQNDRLARRLGADAMKQVLQAEPLTLTEPSLAGHVALTSDILNLHDTHMIPPDRPYAFDKRVDHRCEYRTQSVLVVPLLDSSGRILGVIQLINALNRDGQVIAFDPQYETLVRALASQAAVAIRNARLEALALKDDVTEVYNRRYLRVRLGEECQRHGRTGEPISVVALHLDDFKSVHDQLGPAAGHEVLRQVALLLLRHSRSFTVVSRYGDDNFGVVLASTPKAGGVTYAERIRRVIESHAFRHGPLTASLGVASLPGDAGSAEELLSAAEQAVTEAKRLGRNRVVAAR
jgi:diguanylate cyclase (GGDEF)-like protein